LIAFLLAVENQYVVLAILFAHSKPLYFAYEIV
jgi:hypothetical protein